MSSSEMEMGYVGMRSRGGVGVGTFFGTAFKRGAFGALFRVMSGFGAGGVVESEEDDVELVGLEVNVDAPEHFGGRTRARASLTWTGARTLLAGIFDGF